MEQGLEEKVTKEINVKGTRRIANEEMNGKWTRRIGNEGD